MTEKVNDQEEIMQKLDEMNASLKELIELNRQQLCYLRSVSIMTKSAEVYADIQKVNDEMNEFMSKN